MTDRTCLDCKHWRWYEGYGGWSEYTPGEDATMRCGKGVWELRMNDDHRGDVRDKLKSAMTCKEFTPDDR